MSARAHLAYGYDLGTGEDFRAAERGEYGSPKLPWLNDGEDGEDEGFGGGVERLLLASTGFVEIPWGQRKGYDEDARRAYYTAKAEAEKRCGVELDHSGHSDYAGWVLVAKDSERNVEWSDVMTVDLDELTNRPSYEGWDTKLSDALAALGITPTQGGPKWLVYPSYG
jgi:hypothetical protein